jgi:uncharacterized membrane protein
LLRAALSAGLFYSFSTIVMPGLDFGGPAAAIHAMQVKNTVVRYPIFAAFFFGTLVLPLLGHSERARPAIAAPRGSPCWPQ